ncbi:hypothetical protein ACWGJ9_11250 [Curtobacterium citreum]
MPTRTRKQEPAKRKRDRAQTSRSGDGFSFLDDLLDLIGDLLTFWR